MLMYYALYLVYGYLFRGSEDHEARSRFEYIFPEHHSYFYIPKHNIESDEAYPSDSLLPIIMPTDTSANNINAELKLVMKSGKYKLGYRETLRTLRSGRSKLVLVSNNCPTVRQSEIEYYAMLSKTPVHRFDGGNTELGTACGRYFQVSMLTILESGDSDILQVAGN